jgi:hypothetical protein
MADIIFYTPENKAAALAAVKRRPHPGHYGIAFKFNINSKKYGQDFGSGILCWTDLPALNGLNAKTLFELADWTEAAPGLRMGAWKDPELKDYAEANAKGIAREEKEVEIHNKKIEKHNDETRLKYEEVGREYFITIANMAGVLKTDELTEGQLHNIAKMAVLTGLKVAPMDDWIAIADLPEILEPLQIPTEGDPEAVCHAAMAGLVHQTVLPPRRVG